MSSLSPPCPDGIGTDLCRALMSCAVVCCAVGCGSPAPGGSLVPRFELLSDSVAIGGFVNALTYTEEVNPYTFKSFFNGGGVGVGDLDGDERSDVVLTGNSRDNGVFLNEGAWDFREAATEMGLAGRDAWTTGVTLADVDGDGRLDVYLCKSGPPTATNRRNELRLARPDGTYEDVAAAAGVDDLGLSVHAAFLDYDRDGDLDLYLLNNSLRPVGGNDLRPGARETPDAEGANKLYRNLLAETDTLRFEDVSAEAGIYTSEIGFGLGVSVGDVNGDLWPDLYVSNDFFERDYLYVNRGDGRFAERLTELVPETAMGAMGADMADLDGDGLPEIFVTEMLPRDARRYRSKAQFEDYNRRRLAERNGYHRQYSRNVLLANDGGTGFADVGRLAGVEATDWSWGALLVDLDNDGRRDVFVANGIYKDLLDQDYLKFAADPGSVRDYIADGGDVVRRLIDSMPSEPLGNYAFRNTGGLRFEDVSTAWGLDVPSFSNGAAVGDLDGDGDLDLVVNQLNGPALVYRNRSREDHPATSHYLRVTLSDTLSRANRAAWGSRVTLYAGGVAAVDYLAPVRGFMSCAEPVLHFGLGTVTRYDSLAVEWSSGGVTRVVGGEADRVVTVVRTAVTPPVAPATADTLAGAWTPLPWRHAEDDYTDLDRYGLLPESVSAEGPALAVNVSADTTTVFLGGAAGQPSALLERVGAGPWVRLAGTTLLADAGDEDVAAAWGDLDGDGLADLVVAPGGDGGERGVDRLSPRVYFRRADRGLRRDPLALAAASTDIALGAVALADFDEDGDLDVFCGAHFGQGRYGEPVPSYLMANDGSGGFTLVRSPLLDTLDRVRASAVVEADGDPGPELAVAQDYGPVTILDFGSNLEVRPFASGPRGLWRALAAADLDGDGIDELLAGNHGLNSRLRASAAAPLRLYVADLGDDGVVDQFVAGEIDGTDVVIAQRGALVARVPALRKRFPRYGTYAETDAAAILAGAPVYRELAATELRSGVLAVGRAGGLSFRALPSRAQRTVIRAIAEVPSTEPGEVAFLLAGNFDYVRPEIGGQLGGDGVLIRIRDGGAAIEATRALPPLRGQVRALSAAGGSVIAARNSGAAQMIALP